MNKVEFIIQISMDGDWSFLPKEEEWVRYRIKFFEKYTLKSLLNQTFLDFRIFLLCGQRFNHITSSHPWHEKVEVCYDAAKEKYLDTIDSDHVSITRIDSDDMFHRDAMMEVKNNLSRSNRRECLIFRKNLFWGMVNNVIGHYYAASPPYFTHIFPKAIYKDWEQFRAEHYVHHGRAGGKLASTKELSVHKVCITRHQYNISDRRSGKKPKLWTEEERRKKLATGEYISDRREIARILADFGVEEIGT